MITKVLAVYNICGIKGKENVSYYMSAINSIISQKMEGLQILISGCRTSPFAKEMLEAFKDKVSYNWVDEILPLNVTFNHSIKEWIKVFGKAETYLYIDSGITFGSDNHVISRLYDLMKSSNCAMVAARVDSDDGYSSWGINWNKQDHYFIKPGQTCNLHCQLFSDKIFESYDGILPDIFASDTSESIFFYMCSAIGMRFSICKDVFLHHRWFMDGASAGFRSKPLLFKTARNMAHMCDEGRQYGFGYEECLIPNRSIKQCRHDPSKFANGICNDKNLMLFIKNNMFLQEHEFSYKSIQGNFVPIKTTKTSYISPKITCILVSHNKPQIVKEAIDSLLNQTLIDWQGIIVDSGILYDNNFFDYIKDERITVIKSDESQSMRSSLAMAPYCFNLCLRRNMVKGHFVMYLCDDDVLYHNAFQTFINFAEENPYQSHAMYASQDLTVIKSDGSRIHSGERRAIDKVGKCVGSPMDCKIDYLQFCHSREILEKISFPYWPEGLDTKEHADGIFMDKIGEIVPVYPIDIKLSQNRRTPWSTYKPS